MIVAAQTYAQPGKLMKAGSPQPASIEGYHRGQRATLRTYDDKKIEVLWLDR